MLLCSKVSYRNFRFKKTSQLSFCFVFKSYKTATSVLMDETGTFVEFGFEAELEYAEDIQLGKKNKSLFRHFKMVLHEQEVRVLLLS